MSLLIPNYISTTGIVDDHIKHDWGESEEEAFLDADPRLESRIGAIAYRGVVALSLGSAEWIVWRLSKHIEDPVPLQVIEAMWAAIIDWRYLKWLDIPDWEELPEPVGGPLDMAFNLLFQIVDLVSRKQFASPEAACISELTLHVLNDPEPFKEWRRFTIRRLTQMHRRTDDDVLGDPISREVLDPDFDYKPEIGDKLLSNFLRNLDHTQNPYLCSPEEMISDGFDGTPYLL
jgi:hypothetical protein